MFEKYKREAIYVGLKKTGLLLYKSKSDSLLVYLFDYIYIY